MLVELAQETSDTAVLVMLEGDMAVDVASYYGNHVLQAGTRIDD